jgi:hypothetical protein
MFEKFLKIINEEIDTNKKSQKIVLYGGDMERHEFVKKLDIEADHLRDEIARVAEIIVENVEDQTYYKHLWYRLLIANKILDDGEVGYDRLFNSIKEQVNEVDEIIFNEVWVEVKKKAENLGK